MKLLERYRLLWTRFWLRVNIEIDSASIEQHERSYALNQDRLRRVQKRLGEITPAHVLMREIGK